MAQKLSAGQEYIVDKVEFLTANLDVVCLDEWIKNDNLESGLGSAACRRGGTTAGETLTMS